MREIKFRGQSDGKWYYGSYVKTAVGLHYIISQNMIANVLPQVVVDVKTVGQYIGSKDRNGVEIYGGDITELDVDGEKRRFEVAIETVVRKVKSHPTFADDFAEVEITGVVFKWNGFELFPCTKYLGLNDLERMKVIGNIYENPELLEVS